MRQMRQVPQVGRQPPQFSMPQPPPQYQQFTGTPGAMPGMGQPVQSPEAAVQSQMQGLALDIFTRTAADYLSGRDSVDSVELRQLATNAQTAARAYFESMGVQFEEQQNG